MIDRASEPGNKKTDQKRKKAAQIVPRLHLAAWAEHRGGPQFTWVLPSGKPHTEPSLGPTGFLLWSPERARGQRKDPKLWQVGL